MINSTFTFWGKFSGKLLERKYIVYSTPEIQERNRVALFVAGIIFFLVGVTDFFRIESGVNLYVSLALRGLILLYAVWIFIAWKKPHKITYVHSHISIYALLFAAFLNIIIFLLNPDKTVKILDLYTLPITILLFYVFAYLYTLYLVLIGVFSSFLYILILIQFQNITAFEISVISLILFAVNLLGMYISRFFNMVRRNEFLKIIEIEKLNIGLTDEIEERTAIQDKLIYAYSELTDGMRYANHLQVAMLSDSRILNKYFDEHFVLYKPCEIVSGDFYWFSEFENKIIVVSADCTGHGIRAAFMSIVGITFLEDIVNNKGIIDAHEILNQLKEQIIKNLKQSGTQPTSHDGMDISLCVVDVKKMEMQYAGAYSPLIIIRKGELIEYKADRMPISYFFAAKPSFTNNVIQLEDDDRFYLFTDGYADQFGGPKNKKYTYRRLKRELLTHSQLSMNAQYEFLLNTHMAWKADYNQTDDIVFLGFKI